MHNKRHCLKEKRDFQRNLITLEMGGVKASLSALFSLLVSLRLGKGLGNSEISHVHIYYIQLLLNHSIFKSHFGVQSHN